MLLLPYESTLSTGDHTWKTWILRSCFVVKWVVTYYFITTRMIITFLATKFSYLHTRALNMRGCMVIRNFPYFSYYKVTGTTHNPLILICTLFIILIGLLLNQCEKLLIVNQWDVYFVLRIRATWSLWKQSRDKNGIKYVKHVNVWIIVSAQLSRL